MSRPNILWFSLEDTAPRFGCYGDAVARTPHLDRVAAEGCVYTRAFAVAGVCAPSRSAIITGMYPSFIGAHHMRTTHRNAATPELCAPYDVCPPAYVKCFPEYLRAAGYYCTNNAKTDYQFTAPFTAWDECSDQAHWRNRAPGQPFFAVFNPIRTHESGMWPEPPSWHPAPGPRLTDPAQVVVPPYLADTPATRTAIARQYDNIAASDRELGQRLRELEEDGLLDNTILVIWSDHAEGLPRAKRWPLDSSTRVPLIVRWPGKIAPGTQSDQLVSLLDLAPTMFAMLGLPAPRHFQGQPFVGPAAQPRDYVFATRDRYDEAYDMIRSVRDRRYRYVRNFHPELPYQLWIPYSFTHPAQQDLWRLHLTGQLTPEQQHLFQNSRPPEELYDLDADPFETRNLAADPQQAGELTRLRRVLDEWRRDFDLYGDVPEDEMVRRWYPDGRQPQTVAPIIVPINADHAGQQPTNGGEFRGPLLLQLHSVTKALPSAGTRAPAGVSIPVRCVSMRAPRSRCAPRPFASVSPPARSGLPRS